MDTVGTIIISFIALVIGDSIRNIRKSILADQSDRRDTAFMEDWARGRRWTYVPGYELAPTRRPLTLFRRFRGFTAHGPWPTVRGPMLLAGRLSYVTCGDFRYWFRWGKGRRRYLRFSYLIIKLPLIAEAKLRIRHSAAKRFLRTLCARDESAPAGLERDFSIRGTEPFRTEFLERSKSLFADAPGEVEIASGWLCITDGVRCWDAPEFDQRLQWADRFVAALPPLCFDEACVRSGASA